MHDHFIAWWVPYQDIVQMLLVNRTDFKEQAVEKSPMTQMISVIKIRLIGAVTHLASLLPVHWVPLVNQYLFAPVFHFWNLDKPFYITEGYQGLLCSHTDSYDEMEYFLPLSRFKDAWNEFRQLLEDEKNILGANHIVQLRMIHCDNILLSPVYLEDCKSKPTYFIALAVLCRGFSLDGYYHKAEEIFVRYGGRTHWGKTHFLGRTNLTEIYGDNFHTFLKLRDQLDPNGLFLNEHLRHLFFD